MAPSRQLQNWNEEGLAWRIATTFAEHTRKEDWPAIMGTLKAQGCQFTESALRYVELHLKLPTLYPIPFHLFTNTQNTTPTISHAKSPLPVSLHLTHHRSPLPIQS